MELRKPSAACRAAVRDLCEAFTQERIGDLENRLVIAKHFDFNICITSYLPLGGSATSCKHNIDILSLYKVPVSKQLVCASDCSWYMLVHLQLRLCLLIQYEVNIHSERTERRFKCCYDQLDIIVLNPHDALLGLVTCCTGCLTHVFMITAPHKASHSAPVSSVVAPPVPELLPQEERALLILLVRQKVFTLCVFTSWNRQCRPALLLLAHC